MGVSNSLIGLVLPFANWSREVLPQGPVLEVEATDEEQATLALESGDHLANWSREVLPQGPVLEVEATDEEQATLALESGDDLSAFYHVAHKRGSQWVRWMYMWLHAMKKGLSWVEERLGGCVWVGWHRLHETTPLCIVSGLLECVNKAIDTLTVVEDRGGYWRGSGQRGSPRSFSLIIITA